MAWLASPTKHERQSSFLSRSNRRRGNPRRWKKLKKGDHIFKNIILCNLLGGAVILFSLEHFIAPALNLLPCLQGRGTRDCNKGSKFKKGAMKGCKENKITVPTLMCGIFSFVDPYLLVKSISLYHGLKETTSCWIIPTQQ